MPQQMRHDYLKDCVTYFEESNLSEIDKVTGLKNYITPYKLMIASVQK